MGQHARWRGDRARCPALAGCAPDDPESVMGASLGVYIAMVAGIMAIASGVLEVLDGRSGQPDGNKAGISVKNEATPSERGRHEAGDERVRFACHRP